jgi:DNA-binding transcriptional LysR family regulator
VAVQIRNLKVFCDVVARHSFSKAAEENGMTQSGASQAVQQLEDFLQVQLLDRSKRPFVLTSEGEVFYSGCCKLVRQFENLSEEVRSLGQEISGRATVAAIYSVGLSYLPDVQKELKQRFPKTEVRFQFCHPDEVYRAVEQGSVDFGLVSYPQQSKAISATHWRDEPMVLVAPAGHPLTERGRVTPEDLGLEALIAFAPNLRIRHEIDRYLRSIGITMPIAAEFDNVDSVKHALELNGAVAFLPRPAIVEELESGTLVSLPCDWLTLQRPLGVIQRRDTSLGRTARALYELLLEKVAHHGAAVSGTDSPVAQALENRSMVRELAAPLEDRQVTEVASTASFASPALLPDAAAGTESLSQEPSGSADGSSSEPAAQSGHQQGHMGPRNGAHAPRSSRRQTKVSRKR